MRFSRRREHAMPSQIFTIIHPNKTESRVRATWAFGYAVINETSPTIRRMQRLYNNLWLAERDFLELLAIAPLDSAASDETTSPIQNLSSYIVDMKATLASLDMDSDPIDQYNVVSWKVREAAAIALPKYMRHGNPYPQRLSVVPITSAVAA
jgi:hypothetical protein